MKILLSFCLFACFISAEAQINKDVTIGMLQSFGQNQYRLVQSPTQNLLIEQPTSYRYDNPGLRVRISFNKSFTKHLHGYLQSGFNLRFSEYLWGFMHTYATVPVQGGIGYDLLTKASFKVSLTGFSGINICDIKNDVASQRTGSVHTADLSFKFKRKGFIESIILKTGYEMQVDRQTFFYQDNNPNLHNEDFSYKVKRHQAYLAFGIEF